MSSIIPKQAPEVFCKKKVFFEISQNSQENTCARDSFLTKLKKSLWHGCFSVKFEKFLRTPFLKNNSGRLLLIRFCENSAKESYIYGHVWDTKIRFTFPVLCIYEIYVKIKINLNSYFHTSLWYLKRPCEGPKGLHKTLWDSTQKCEVKMYVEFFSSSGIGWEGLIDW